MSGICPQQLICNFTALEATTDYAIILLFMINILTLSIKCRLEPSLQRNHCGNPEKMHMCDWVTGEIEEKNPKRLLLQNLAVDRLLKGLCLCSRKLAHSTYMNGFH